MFGVFYAKELGDIWPSFSYSRYTVCKTCHTLISFPNRPYIISLAGWQKTTFFTKSYCTAYYKGLFYVPRPVILRVHLMYLGSFLCTPHYHRTIYYKGPSYVLYIRWTLIRSYLSPSTVVLGI